jgi:hypothetical protein
MTRPDLETKLIDAWDDAIADLTPAERERLSQMTAQDVIRAIAELIADPGFWQRMGIAFLQGMARGFEKHLNAR